jgi:hypothetical protein
MVSSSRDRSHSSHSLSRFLGIQRPETVTEVRATFRLKVRRVEQSCLFDLSDEAGQELSATLGYDESLTELYQNWQQLYSRRYTLAARARVVKKGSSATPPAYDWDQELKLAETALLQAFDRWLGQAALLEIRERIQREIKLDSLASFVEIWLDCSPIDLARLPWEAWKLAPKDAPSGTVRLARTVFSGVASPLLERGHYRSKVRVLAIFADASDLKQDFDLQALQQLHGVAEIETLHCQVNPQLAQPSQQVAALKQQVAEAIADDRGWDVLFFAGHSDEAASTGGTLELAPNVSVSIVELTPLLTQAKQRGLQLAIFNSCSGLHIANSLIQLGLSQVIVMRERIQDQVAHEWLMQFCRNLATYQTVHQALIGACDYLTTEQLAYPSAYLIPSLFRHPDRHTSLFQIEPSPLKRVWQTWRPTRWQAATFGIISLVSWMTPIQDVLSDHRYWIQALYRHHTGQLTATAPPPVTIVSINQDSIDRNNIDIYKVKPIDRTYLAKLIDRLQALQVNVIGIDYFLDGSTNQDPVLAKSLRSAVQQQQTWFVFASSRNDAGQEIRVSQQLASPRWTLQGEVEFLNWQVMLPAQVPCRVHCPFAYQLALIHTLNQAAPNLPQPSLQSSSGLQSQLVNYLGQSQDDRGLIPLANSTHSPQAKTLDFLQQPKLPLGLQPVIDFSLPPHQVYQSIAAWDFLERSLNDPALQSLREQVVIVASGGYDQADDNFSVPLAIDYWRTVHDRYANEALMVNNNTSRVFTGGEAHAYAAHHLLTRHLLLQVPTFWMVMFATGLGKVIIVLLMRQKNKQRQRSLFILSGTTIFYGLISLQIYVSFSFLIPWLLPTILLWLYIVPTQKQ